MRNSHAVCCFFYYVASFAAALPMTIEADVNVLVGKHSCCEAYVDFRGKKLMLFHDYAIDDEGIQKEVDVRGSFHRHEQATQNKLWTCDEKWGFSSSSSSRALLVF